MKTTSIRLLAVSTLTFQLLAAAAASAAPKVLSLALETEPPQLNSMKATDTESGFILGHVMEGLTRYGKGNDVEPGVAERWEINDKGATFFLRKSAKWSDGKPVTAKDFVFAWRTTLDPKTASEYAFILYPIKNAEAINQGKLPGTELGAVASDDYTLKITFEKPTGYFLGLTAFATYSPVREDFYKSKGDRYAADAADLIANGPYMLTKWTHGASLTLERNPHYWNKDRIPLDRIEVPYITPDNNALFNFFKDRKTDVVKKLNRDDIAKATQQGFRIKNFLDGSMFYMEFNFREGRPTRNLNLRKAIQHAYNPTELVQKVISIPGTKAGVRLIPSYFKGVKDAFWKEHAYSAPKPDLAKAKQFLELAKKELGGRIPPLVWLCDDKPQAAREAEYAQNVFKTVLGIDLKIDKQIFKQRLEKMKQGDFDIVAAGWGPDFMDPMTFAELKASWNENNRGKYANPEFDKHIRNAQATADQKVRMKEMAAAERIAMEEVAILPMYERAQPYLTSDRVSGVVRRVIGPDPDFMATTAK